MKRKFEITFNSKVSHLRLGVVLVALLIAANCFAASGGGRGFTPTPLIDQPSGIYVPGSGSHPVQFQLGLYGGSNLLSDISPAHDAQLKAASASIVPICNDGNAPSRQCPEGGTGLIGFAQLGFSVSIQQTCTGPLHPEGQTAPPPPGCAIGSADHIFFQYQQGSSPTVNPDVAIADCDQSSATMSVWAGAIGTSSPFWQNCINTVLPNAGLSANQIEAVAIEAAAGSPRDGFGTMSSLTHIPCKSGDERTVAACYAEQNTATVLRELKQQWPNLKIAYLYNRSYGGWAAADSLNPEPYAYEDGFSVQFLILAQINQADNGGAADSEAGDLSYANAPVLSWGGYQWADGNIANSEGISWPENDFSTGDETHYSHIGYPNSANTMINFFLAASPTGADHQNYTTWFRP